jgi:hypothetical protein
LEFFRCILQKPHTWKEFLLDLWDLPDLRELEVSREKPFKQNRTFMNVERWVDRDVCFMDHQKKTEAEDNDGDDDRDLNEISDEDEDDVNKESNCSDDELAVYKVTSKADMTHKLEEWVELAHMWFDRTSDGPYRSDSLV